MKKIGLFLISLIFLFVTSASAVVSYSSGTIYSTKEVAVGKGALVGVLVLTDGTNAATVTLRDGESGKVLTGPFVVSGASRFGGCTFEIPVRYDNSLHVTISGTGASAIVYYTHEL